LRADAVRNIERIVAGAQRVFARAGADAAMDDVAAEAGVGVATVYRRFPTKESLLRAVLYRRFDEVVEVALRQAEQEPDPREAMRIALSGAVSFLADDDQTVAAGSSSGLMTMDLAYRFVEPVAHIVRRGQRDGVIRTDLVTEDIPRIVLMLAGALPSMHPATGGWHRYLDLILDMLCATRTELSAPTALRDHQPWPTFGRPYPDHVPMSHPVTTPSPSEVQ
jgi:AcrR family transcriptional regulator